MTDREQIIEQMVNAEVERLNKLTDEEQQIEMQQIKESCIQFKKIWASLLETKNAHR